MMKEQDNFDDLVWSKFQEEGNFPFDEENWVKAEELIDNSRRKEKNRKWAIIFFTGVFLGVLVIITFMVQEAEKPIPSFDINEKTQEANSKKENKQIAQSAQGITEQNLQASSPGASTTTQRQKVFVSESSSREKRRPGGNAPSTTETNAQGTTLSTGASYTAERPEKRKPATRQVSSAVIADDQNGNEEPVANAHLNDQASIVPSEKKTTPGTNTAVKEIVAVKAKDNSTAQGINPASASDAKVALSASKNIENKDSSRTDAPGVAITAQAVKKDSAAPPGGVPAAEKKDSVPAKNHWSIFADAGINGFVSGGNGISPYLGLNAFFAFNSQLEIGGGIFYTYMPIHSGTATFTTSATYDFGSTLKLTEIVTDKLHYAVAPLFLKYNFNTKNALLLGANFYYLFNSSNVITNYDLSYGGIQNISTTKATGYYSGFSTYNLGIMAGYRKKLADRVSVGLYLNCGMRPVQKSNYYHDINVGRNISAQLVLTYKLFK